MQTRRTMWAALVLACIVAFAAGQTSPVRSFAYRGFKAQDERDFGVMFNPSFGPDNLQLSFYDPSKEGEDLLAPAAVWFKQRVLVDNFETTFTIRVSNRSDPSLGHTDGFAFVMQNSRAGTSSFSPAPGGLGYGSTPDWDGIPKSVAVEFDTWQNEELNDPNSNHISVHYTRPEQLWYNSAHEDTALSPPGPVTYVPLIRGATHTVRVLYKNRLISLFVDGVQEPFYQGVIDVFQSLNLTSPAQGAFIGLTTYSQGSGEDIVVSEWSYRALAEVDPSKSFITGLGDVIYTGIPTIFRIHTIDVDGYPCLTCAQADKFAVEFTSMTGSSSIPPAITIKNDNNGVFTVQVNVPQPDSYFLNITYDGHPIGGAMPSILAEPALPLASGQCVQLFQATFTSPSPSNWTSISMETLLSALTLQYGETTPGAFYAVGLTDFEASLTPDNLTQIDFAHFVLYAQSEDDLVSAKSYGNMVRALLRMTGSPNWLSFVLRSSEKQCAPPTPPANATELCTISVEGTFAVPDVESFPVNFDRVTFLAKLNSTISASNLSLSFISVNASSTWLIPVSLNAVRFTTAFSVLKSESSGVASRLIGGVVAAVDETVGGPYDSALVKATSNRSWCWQPYPVVVRRCLQVSAKLESGLPFTRLGYLNTTSSTNSTASLAAGLHGVLARGLASSGVVSNVETISVQSLAAVPVEEPDTLQVAVRLVLAVDDRNLPLVDPAVGVVMTQGLQSLVEVEGEAPLFEVGFTITPCHTPF